MMNTITDATNGNIDNLSKKVIKSGDSKMGANQPRNSLEKIGSRKGTIRRNTEIADPTIRVFHAYLRVYSIDDMFE